MTNNNDAIQLKIRRLEKAVFLLLLTVLALTVQVISPLFSSNIQQAQGFQLVNKNNQVLAGLELEQDFPQLYLTDLAGNKRLVATHNDDGSHIFLKDQTGTTRVGIAQFAHGGGGFALHGEQSKGAAVLYLKETASLRFFDQAGNVIQHIKAKAPSDKE